MKKHILCMILLLMSSSIFCQWIKATIPNQQGFDDEKYAYIETDAAKLTLKQYKGNGYTSIALYFAKDNFCAGEYSRFDISFNVKGTWITYKDNTYTSLNNTTKIKMLTGSVEYAKWLKDFKSCSEVKITTSSAVPTCGVPIHTFNMKGSTDAFNYVLNQ